MDYFVQLLLLFVAALAGNVIGQSFARWDMRGKIKNGSVMWFEGDEIILFRTTRIDISRHPEPRL